MLFIAATGLAACAVRQGWARHRPVIGCAVVLLAVVAGLLAWRTAHRSAPGSRIAWTGAVAAFGLWTAILLSNQFHGRPPPSDRYFLVCSGLAGVLSACGMALDPRQPSAG
jgi:hypothetical protein